MNPKYIVIHHSASRWGTVQVIDKWHRERKPAFRCIGYHFVILNGYVTHKDSEYGDSNRWHSLDGQIQTGRPLNKDAELVGTEKGAHVRGYNGQSIGICLIHDGNDSTAYNRKITKAQEDSLVTLVLELIQLFGIKIENIKGHCELDYKKPHCPSINMDAFRQKIREKKGENTNIGGV